VKRRPTKAFSERNERQPACDRLAIKEGKMSKDLLKAMSFDRRRVLQGIAGGFAAAGTTTLFAPSVRAANKPIRIGYVSPKSGPLAAFAEADDFVLGEFRKYIKDGVKVGSQTYPVEVITKDSQSNPNRAAEVAKELITRDNVGLIVVGATPETNNPVATQCELEQVPCISTVAPWQTNFIGRQANPGDPKSWKPFEYTYHYFWGLEDVIGVFTSMWSQVATNKSVGALFPNDADGNAWGDTTIGFPQASGIAATGSSPAITMPTKTSPSSRIRGF
jgi:branched-chain amino acid transport system substrate-binding protein